MRFCTNGPLFSDNCTVVEKYSESWRKGEPKIVNCTGAALSLKEQCKKKKEESPSCNFYPNDEDRNYYAPRSHVDICNDNRYDLKVLWEY